VLESPVHHAHSTGSDGAAAGKIPPCDIVNAPSKKLEGGLILDDAMSVQLKK
jgi:hypothetical protein